MSCELPYFRFTVQEWQNGDITLEDYENQGIFINICCYYWISDCSITLAKLKHRLTGYDVCINHLIESGIIKHNKETDFIEIFFLDDQFDLLSNRRKLCQKAGKKGGKQKSSKAKAKLKQSPSYKDKDKDKDKDKEKKKHPFEKSPLFVKETFLARFPDWDKSKCQYWYNKAITYSGANGGRYLDWGLAIAGWERGDSGKQIKPNPDSMTI